MKSKSPSCPFSLHLSPSVDSLGFTTVTDFMYLACIYIYTHTHTGICWAGKNINCPLIAYSFKQFKNTIVWHLHIILHVALKIIPWRLLHIYSYGDASFIFSLEIIHSHSSFFCFFFLTISTIYHCVNVIYLTGTLLMDSKFSPDILLIWSCSDCVNHLALNRVSKYLVEAFVGF